MLQYWLRCRLWQMTVDIVVLLLVFVGAYFARVDFIFSSDFPFWPYFYFSLMAVLAWVGFLALAKYYRIPPRSGSRTWFDIILLFLGAGVGLSSLLVTFFFNETYFSRLITAMAFGGGICWLLFSQFIFRYYLRQQKKAHRRIYRTIIIGANRVSEQLAQQIQSDPYALHHIIGVIDPYGLTKTFVAAPLLGKLERLETICRQENITALIQCDAFEHTLNMVSLCEDKKIQYFLAPFLRGIFSDDLRVRDIANKAMISLVFSSSASVNMRRWVARQIFDLD